MGCAVTGGAKILDWTNNYEFLDNGLCWGIKEKVEPG